MAVIGKLIEERGVMRGRLQTLTMALKFGLEPREDRRGDDEPTHDVKAETAAGPVVIGVAWLRKITRGDQSGKDMYSLALDDPSWPMALNVNAYPDLPGQFDIVWRRERREAANA